MTNTVKTHVQTRFSQTAQDDVESQPHAPGWDLDTLIMWAQPEMDWLVLDVATGDSHTALIFAPHVHWVITTDSGEKDIHDPQAFIDNLGTENISFSRVDTHSLPFCSGIFDLITCRTAPHRFQDSFRFVQECCRVLKSGGRLLIQDYVSPNNPQAGRYVNAFERLNDPSQKDAYTEYEWQSMFLDVGLVREHTKIFITKQDLLFWAKLQDCTPSTIEQLQIMLHQVPSLVIEWLHPQYVGTPYAKFDNHHIIIMGHKR